MNNSQHQIINYADDTTLLIKAKQINILIDEASVTIAAVQNWLLQNQLILNKEKSNFIIFRTNHAKFNFPLNININGDNVTLTSETKFLGVITDCSLTWAQHIEYLRKKLNSTVYSLRVIKRVVSFSTLRTIYYACFMSKLKFGILFWGGAAAVEINKIFIIQKQAIRIMHDIALRDTCRGHFKQHRYLTVVAIYIFDCLMFNFKYKTKFDQYISRHDYNTRHINYNFPVHRLSMFENGPYYASIKFFNVFPNKFKNMNNFKQFKREIFNYLVEVEPYTVQEFIKYKKSQL